jgi:uncharacterized protein (DUF4415 family)
MKRGRPKTKDPRQLVSLRLTEEELTSYQNEAKRSEMKTSAWIRRACDAELKRRVAR